MNAIPAETGSLVELAPGVRRLTAPNPSLMTGPGTNTYIIGVNEFAVVDPGPPLVEHVERLVELGAGRIRWILATHTHPDHSPAVRLLARETGAEALGIPPPRGRHQDQTFAPNRVLADGDSLSTDEFELLAVHTPGHASNHLCFLHRTLRWLFTGDHIINGSTVVIDPPDGNMAHYLDSLSRLMTFDIERIAPGHGALINSPREALEALTAHRLQREAKVLESLAQVDTATLSDLVKAVYDEVPTSLHRLAERSLLAHLLKLETDGRVLRVGEYWSVVATDA